MAAVCSACGLEQLRGHTVTTVGPAEPLDSWDNVLSVREGAKLEVQLCSGPHAITLIGDLIQATPESLALSDSAVARSEIAHIDHLQDHTASHQWRDVWLPAAVGGGLAGIIVAVAPNDEHDPSAAYAVSFFTALGAGIGLYQYWLDRQIAPVALRLYDRNCGSP